MTLNVTIPDDLAGKLESFAKARSQTPAQIAIIAIEREVSALERLDKELAPVRAAFEASGMTDDELSDLINEEIHALRRERRAASEK